MSNSSCLCNFVSAGLLIALSCLVFLVLSWLSDPADQNGSVRVSGAADVLRNPGVCGECVCTAEDSDDCMTESVAYRIYINKIYLNNNLTSIVIIY